MKATVLRNGFVCITVFYLKAPFDVPEDETQQSSDDSPELLMPRTNAAEK